MKKKIIVFAFIGIFLISGYFVLQVIEMSKNKKVLLVGSEIPSASFRTLENKPFYLDSLKNEKLTIMHFSVNCPHCISEFEALEKKNSILDSVRFIFIGKENPKILKKFINDFPKIREKSEFLYDLNKNFSKNFGSSAVPNTFIYENRKLIKNYRGAFDVEKMCE
jgi:thiol-disulfide isomerase/thioredoxin